MSDFHGLPSTASTTQPSDFAKEEWEDWMKWDGPLDSLSANSPRHSPPPLQYVSGSLGSTSPSEFDSLPPVNFSPVYALPTTESKKRKGGTIAIARDAPLTGSGRQPRGKKVSHNVIEKRYRSNLNDKIAKLRDSIPELRSAPPTIKRRPQKPVVSDSEGSGEDGTSQGLKFNKATVLIKATEYIQQLERQNQRLVAEVSTLRNRNGSKNHLQTPPVISTAISKTFVNFINPTSQAPEKPKDQAKVETQVEVGESSTSGMIEVPADVRRLREEVPPQDHYAPGPSSSGVDAPSTIPPWSEVKGMIPLSESWQRFRARPKVEEHYAPASPVSHVPELEDPPLDDDEGSRWSRSRMMSRVLVGSLAGLMVMEGFSEQEEDSPIQKRGLFSLPNELLTESRGFRVPIRRRIIAFGTSGRAWQALPILSVSCVFLMVFFVVFVYSIPQESKAIREGPLEESKDAEESKSNSEPPPTSPTSLVLPGPGSTVLSHPHVRQFSVFGESYVLKLIQWLGLSSLMSQTHDEEAASRLDIHALRRERWLGYLRVIPRFGEDMLAT
ncbi:hypothetical protein MMC10_007177 [Thelotrema lepadinum]|nr:hypothetical protein [Thelotrema lepadinum]